MTSSQKWSTFLCQAVSSDDEHILVVPCMRNQKSCRDLRGILEGEGIFRKLEFPQNVQKTLFMTNFLLVSGRSWQWESTWQRRESRWDISLVHVWYMCSSVSLQNGPTPLKFGLSWWRVQVYHFSTLLTLRRNIGKSGSVLKRKISTLMQTGRFISVWHSPQTPKTLLCGSRFQGIGALQSLSFRSPLFSRALWIILHLKITQTDF